VEKVITSTGMLGLIMQSDEKIWNLQVITALFDFVKEETRRNPDLSLSDFVATIQQMEDRRIRIPLVQIGGTEKGVNLLTAHGSKGLEFEYVFFAGCNATLWEKKRKSGGHYTLPDTIFSSKPATSDEEELRRLFYVAITRAERHLFISYPVFDNKGGGLEPTKFIEEIQDVHSFQVKKMKVEPEDMMEFQAQLFMDTAAPEIEQIESDFISRILEKFVLSVTALNNFLKCPLEFYFKNLIRIPSPKNEQAAFGSAIHFAIQRFFEKMKADPMEQFPQKEELIRDFEWYMRRNRECFLRPAFERRMEYGRSILGDYYNEYIHQWNKIVILERTIRNVVIQGVPIKGKLDKLEFNNKLATVVDYKTGNPDNGRRKLQRPDQKNENGGDYWRQAVFYKILVENYGQNNWTVAATEFDFIEPDKKKEFQKISVEIHQDDIDTVTKQITDTWHKIQDRQFYTGCGKKDCEYCNFVKTNELYTRLHEVEEEDEIPTNV
jgi:DNA helicase II / ATP-dependent DNA helicase PcrA